MLFDLLVVVAGADGDPTRLHRLRHLPDQVDLQKTGIKGGPLNLDVVSQVENPPEGSRRDALVKILMFGFVGLPPFDGEDVLFGRDGDLVGREAG